MEITKISLNAFDGTSPLAGNNYLFTIQNCSVLMSVFF